jgi:hypothetical protein
MAIFISRYSRLNFLDMQFVNGRYETEDPKKIRLLSSGLAKANLIARLDVPPKSVVTEPKIEEKVETEKAVESSDKPKRSADGKFAKKK